MTSRRSSSRSHEARPESRLRPGDAPGSANDSLVGSTVIRRVRAARAADTLQTLTPFETELVTHLGRVRYATRTQLTRLVPAVSTPLAQARRTQRSLASLVERRVLARLDRDIGGRRGGSDGPIYALDVIGQRLVWKGSRRLRRPWFVGERFSAHVLAVTETYVRLVEAKRHEAFELIEFASEPACWRRFVDRSGQRQTLKPDAFVHVAEEKWEYFALLEVDLATESPTTITRKARVYASARAAGVEQERLGLFPMVLWLTVSEHRRQVLVETFARLPAEQWQLHQVARLEDVALALHAPTSVSPP
jgi:protein involved in plasmid replication-relaxation